MNRAVGRDSITIEADLRHVRETLKDLDLEGANHTATPCTVERKKEDNERSDESKGGNQCDQGQCRTKHDWDDAGNGDDKNRSHEVQSACSTQQLLVTRPTRSQVCVNASMLCDGKPISV